MTQVISWILGIFAIIGGIDYLIGNKYGLGERFEKALMLIGPMALSIIGIMCMVPILSAGMNLTLVPLLGKMGIDPAILGGLIPIDWGGYFLSQDLAADAKMAYFGGIIIAGTFGTAICFVIPLGVRVLGDRKREAFAKGILEGLCIVPVAIIVSGLAAGFSFGTVLKNGAPVIILSILLLIGIAVNLPLMVRIFMIFAKILRAIGAIGMTAGAFQQLTGTALIPGLKPIAESLKTVSGIGVHMMGCLPMEYVLTRLLKKPLGSLAAKLEMKEDSLSNLLTVLVSGTSGVIALQECDERGIEMNGAYQVCSTSGISAQLSFVMANCPEILTPFLISKLGGAVLATVFAVFMMNRRSAPEQSSEGAA